MRDAERSGRGQVAQLRIARPGRRRRAELVNTARCADGAWLLGAGYDYVYGQPVTEKCVTCRDEPGKSGLGKTKKFPSIYSNQWEFSLAATGSTRAHLGFLISHVDAFASFSSFGSPAPTRKK